MISLDLSPLNAILQEVQSDIKELKINEKENEKITT